MKSFFKIAVILLSILLFTFIVAILMSKNVSNLHSQLRYPIVGTYKNKSAQGMAIWQDKAYLFNDGGHCRVINLKSGEFVREFDLESASANTHVNAACFGSKTYEGLPVVYISEYNMPSRCFVESIDSARSRLIQTIQAKENGNNLFVQSWIVDAGNNYIYAIARQSPPKGEKNSANIKISKYRLPNYTEGKNIVLSEKDVQDVFFVEFASGTQGGVIKDNIMYLPTGLAESSKGAFNAKRILQVIDLDKKKLIRQIDLTYLTTNEPEDMDFYDDKALIYCGQQGGLYEIKLN